MNTISGLSFYDSLNKMTIGILVLLLIDKSSEDIKYDIVSMFLFIVVAFIVGCFFQMIVQIITGDAVLKKSKKNRLEKINIDLKKSNNHFCKTQYKLIKSLFFSLFTWTQWTNNPKLIQEAHNDVYKYSINSFEINRRYFKAYYNVVRNGLLMNIPILEALENFMRNLIFYFILLIVLSCTPISILLSGVLLLIISVMIIGRYLYSRRMVLFSCAIILFVVFFWGNIDNSIIGRITTNEYCRLILCVIAIFISYWLRKEIQYKIHYLIWEGDYYIRRLDKERNKA